MEEAGEGDDPEVRGVDNITIKLRGSVRYHGERAWHQTELTKGLSPNQTNKALVSILNASGAWTTSMGEVQKVTCPRHQRTRGY